MKKLLISLVALFFMAVAPSFAVPRPAVPYNGAAYAASTTKKTKKHTTNKKMSKKSTKSSTAKSKKKS
jgi:uncharacterized protein YxeA